MIRLLDWLLDIFDNPDDPEYEGDIIEKMYERRKREEGERSATDDMPVQ